MSVRQRAGMVAKDTVGWQRFLLQRASRNVTGKRGQAGGASPGAASPRPPRSDSGGRRAAIFNGTQRPTERFLRW